MKTEELVAGKGVVVKWERIRRQNHWLDALAYACAAGHFVGVRLIDEAGPKRSSTPARVRPHDYGIQRPGGGPWIDFDGWREMAGRYLG